MRKLLFIAATILLVTNGSAQQEVILDHVTNSIGDTLLIAGNTHVLAIRFRNLPLGACTTAGFNSSNGFVLTSPDGATWNHTIGTFSDAFNNLNWVATFLPHFEDPFPGGGSSTSQANGVSPDYLRISGVILHPGPTFGLIPGFDDIALNIEIVTNVSDTDLHICIDKSELGRLNSFSWPGIARAECNVVPSWGGPYCFTIVATCCQGSVGNVDFDDAGIVDISDLTLLIDHLFINFPPLLCDDEANIDGDPEGTVDIADLTLLIDHLFINFPPLSSCQ